MTLFSMLHVIALVALIVVVAVAAANRTCSDKHELEEHLEEHRVISLKILHKINAEIALFSAANTKLGLPPKQQALLDQQILIDSNFDAQLRRVSEGILLVVTVDGMVVPVRAYVA